MLAHTLRQLRVNLKRADRVNVVAKQVDTERQFAAEAIDVQDATAKGKLTGFIDVVNLVEAQFAQEIRHVINGYGLTLTQHQRLVTQLFLRHHQLCQRLRITDDEQLRGDS